MVSIEPVPETKDASESRQRLVFTGLCMDFCILIPEILAILISGCVTLLSDVIKCANEMLATTFALLIIRRVTQGGKFTYDYGMGKFETLTRIITGIVMFISICILLIFTTWRILHPEPFDMHAAYIGIPLMIFASIVDFCHWKDYYRHAQRESTPIMETQWRLRRAKTFSDLLILLALILSVVFAHNHWAEYIDPIFSFVIIGFLLLAGYREISASLPDLFDKTLEEELQMLILRELSSSFDKYSEFNGVRSRRSGNRVYIEIFLAFDPEQRAGEVQDYATTLKKSLESQIPGSVVSVVISQEQ
ncbi:MAG: cation-efflux pump [Methanomicrobiales archaeon]|nr:cation-efflux pump [Methanomicrobiales archaeon]